MAKFSPGDKVIVRPDIVTMSNHTDIKMEDNGSRVWLESSHKEFAGFEVTIDEIFYYGDNEYWCYKIREDNHEHYWADGMFEYPEDPVVEISESNLMEVLDA